MLLTYMYMYEIISYYHSKRAKTWQLPGHQWKFKTDQGHQKLRFDCLMCDYDTEFKKVARHIMWSTKLKKKKKQLNV